LEPAFRPALLHRGFLALVHGKTEQALADFEEVLKPPAEKRLIVAAFYRGGLYISQRKFREALADFDLVAKEDSTFRDVYLLRAQLHFLQDDPRGLGDLTTYLELGMRGRSDAKDHTLFALRGRLLQQLVESRRIPPKEDTLRLAEK